MRFADDYEPAPDLDHTNDKVRAGLTGWLQWLHKEIGFSGFRFDYVKARCFVVGHVA